ncbi:hypothetical protein L596_028388 [Steinernema carpocapsae]|uniref:dolichyl-phosphate-mannose--protein mannosyltransferase n=1 Tax=Steinernema carpocapsae TaxID=34508 RepID=A0A4V5ZXW4_STECR|nr:hypothetical protein L596_028388 [Steinernema carpocapsae]
MIYLLHFAIIVLFAYALFVDYETMKPREFHTPSRVDFFVVAAVAFATFANSLRGGFVFDDNQAIVSNADVLGSSSLFNVFQNDFWGSPISHPGSHRSYRPLTILSFRLNYLFGQLNPFGFHLANVLLHAIVSCFVLELSKRFFERRDSRLFSALLFAVHPVHSEAVANLVGRADLFAALVSLAAYLIYDKCQCPHTSALLCLFGLGFKETSIAVLPLIIVRALLAGDGKRHCAQLLAYAGILSILRLWINEFQNPEFSFSDNPIAHHPSFLVRTATFAYLPLVNLGLMLVPHKLCFDWSMDSIPPIKSFFDLRLWLTFGFYSLTSLATYNNLSFQAPLASPPRKRKRSPSPRYDLNANLIPPSQRNSPVPPEENESNFRIPLAVAFLVIPFLPASNIFTYVGFVVAERILYLPSVGFCLLIAMIYEKSGDYKKAFYVILVLFALRSVARNDDWNDEERLYRSAVEINPAKAFSNLGNVLTQKKRFSEALDSYQQALTHRPNMADTHYNMGVLYMDQNDLSKAIESYQNAIHFRPSFASAYLNLGLAFWNTKDLKQSEKTFQECGKVNGAKLKSLRIVEAAKTGCRYNLGRLLVAQDRLEEAVEVYEEAVVKMPGQYDGEASLYNMLGEAHFKLGRVDEAERWYQKAMEAKKDHVPVYLTMANLRIKENRLDEAKTLFLTALSLDSQNTNVYLHLGRFYSLIEDWNNALSTFETALLSHSNHPDLLLGAANALRQLGIHDRAEKLYEALVEVRPDATSFSNLGAILHLNKKHGKAEKFYEKALELNQKDEVTQKNLKKLRRLMRK